MRDVVLTGLAGGIVLFNRVELALVFRIASASGNDEASRFDEGGRHADSRIEKSARVVAKIKHHALERLFLVELHERVGHVGCRAFLKLRDADVGQAVAQGLGLHRLNLDDVAHELDDDGLGHPLAGNGKCDRGLGFAAHELDVFVEAQVGRGFSVNLDDQVASHDAGLGRGRIVNWIDNAHALRILGDFQAETAEFAHRGLFHVLEGVEVEIGRVRVKPLNHASNGVFNQVFAWHFIDVVILDGAENVRKEADFFKRNAFFGLFLLLRLNVGGKNGTAEECSGGQKKGKSGAFESLRGHVKAFQWLALSAAIRCAS